MRFQTTRPLRGATIYILPDASKPYRISTHAPLAGRDNVTKGAALGES